MKFLNRTALVVKPRQPLLDWIKGFTAQESPTLEELRHEASVYLMDEPQEETSPEALLKRLTRAHFAEIFDNELSIWDEFGEHPPQQRDLVTFHAWFEVSLSGLVFDAAKAPLMVADVDQI